MNWIWLTYEQRTEFDWHMIHSFASLICVMWYEQLHSENRICCSYQSIFTFDFWFVLMNVVSWHRNAPPVNWNWIHARFHVLVIWIQSSRVSVSNKNKSNLIYQVSFICQSKLVLIWYQVQFFVHMSIKINSYVNLTQKCTSCELKLNSCAFSCTRDLNSI